jgi:hypothetical protein
MKRGTAPNTPPGYNWPRAARFGGRSLRDRLTEPEYLELKPSDFEQE